MEKKANFLEHNSNVNKHEMPSSSTDSNVTSSTTRSSRNSFKPVEWDLCLFRQEQNRQKLYNITTFSVSDLILKNAKYDNTLRVKLRNVCDLIAAEGNYHLKCINTFKYETQKTSKASKCKDLAMIFLVYELEYAAKKAPNFTALWYLEQILWIG